MSIEIQMRKCQNHFSLSFELCHLILFGIWNLANGIAMPGQVGAGTDW